MIHGPTLLRDLQRLLKTLEADLRIRIGEQAEINASLEIEWQAARDAGRTGGTYIAWLDEKVTQAAAHWILGCVFVRFLEDNDFLDRPYLSGPAEHLALARDRHEQYFRSHPIESDREYLLDCFREVARMPGMPGLFDERHSPVFRLGISGDRAMELLAFWQKVDPDTGRLVHDFRDPERGTRFLGDLYQDLSESARKRYALLQTPIFVEEFILDRTLTPAIDEFGYRGLRLIDPTCGSGHFLLGAFERLFDVWARKEPSRNLRDLAQQALNGVYGVDVNPFAVAIARFRLLLAALVACDEKRLKDAPYFTINLAAGDSLLHGRRFNQLDLGREAENLARGGLAHVYRIEDLDEINRILGSQYHVVVGNPPYITVKDAALNVAYRSRYSTCHMKYSLAVPFTERFFELALPPRDVGSSAPDPLPNSPPSAKSADRGGRPKFPLLRSGGGLGRGLGAGYVGMITANSFMKREFGSKLIEQFLPRVDLTHVIDTSGAYIPGHNGHGGKGTPTVILFGRDRRPVGDTVRTVMGIKGEPTTPEDPVQGLVWRAIVTQVDRAGSETAYVSVTDTSRATFAKHPWSIGGGGAAELKGAIELMVDARLSRRIHSIGFMAITGEDEAYRLPHYRAIRMMYPVQHFIIGDMVRDWILDRGDFVLFPYALFNGNFLPADVGGSLKYVQHRWNLRTDLRMRSMFGKTAEEHGFRWDQYMQFIDARVGAQYLITFAFVATHNHFVLDRGGKVFNRTAPVIKLPANATEDEHLGLLGLLNSSVACFWGRQVFFPRGGFAAGKWEERLEWDGTKIQEFPLAEPQPIDLARRLDTLARTLADTLSGALLARANPREQDDIPVPAQGQGGGRTPDPGAVPASTTDSPRVPERRETGIKK